MLNWVVSVSSMGAAPVTSTVSETLPIFIWKSTRAVWLTSSFISELHGGLKSLGFGADLITADGQTGQVVNAQTVCFGREDHAAIQILRRDFGADDGCARRIGDSAGNSRAELLAPGGTRQCTEPTANANICCYRVALFVVSRIFSQLLFTERPEPLRPLLQRAASAISHPRARRKPQAKSYIAETCYGGSIIPVVSVTSREKLQICLEILGVPG